MIDMKNVINYYYGIAVNEFKKRDTKFIFYIKENEFEFVEYYGNIGKLINIYSILKTFKKEVDEIILNNQNSIITYYENRPYILLKKIKNKRVKIKLNDILNYDSRVFVKDNLNWKNLWVNKLDYYSIQLEENSLKFPILKESSNYYFGMSEIAINLLNYVDYKNVNFCISHRRLEKKYDLVNPLNIIIDNKARDIAEYIKIQYFYEEINEEEIINFLVKINFTKDEIILLISRLIYPSYYFDIYEKIYIGEKNEKDLVKIIKKNDSYESFLKNIYNNIKYIYNIPQIEFLEN